MAPTEKGQDDNFKTHIMSNSNSQPQSRFHEATINIRQTPTHGEMLEKVEEIKEYIKKGDDTPLYRRLLDLEFRKQELEQYAVVHMHAAMMLEDMHRLLDGSDMICDNDELKRDKLSQNQLEKAEHLSALLGDFPDEVGLQRIKEIHERWCKEEIEEMVKRHHTRTWSNL